MNCLLWFYLASLTLTDLKTELIKHRDFTNLQVGIVGAGLMGNRHAVAIKRAGADLLAVADLDLHAARHLFYHKAVQLRNHL